MMDHFERELSLESEMIGLGDSRMWASVLKAREHAEISDRTGKSHLVPGEESRTKYARRIMAGDGKNVGALETFTKDLKEYLERYSTVKGAAIPRMVRVLHQFPDPAVVAFIGLQVVLDSITAHKKLVNTAVLVGRSLEDELRFMKFEQENKAFWAKLRDDLSTREPNMNRRRSILIHEMVKGGKKQRSLRWKSWSKEDHLAIGSKVIDLLEHSTGLIRTYTVRERKKTIKKIAATVDTLAWIAAFMERGGLMAPAYLPTIIPPRRWKSPSGGGYYMQGLKTLKLVKVYEERGNNYLQELALMPKQMRPTYAALNSVQSTPWKINTSILAVLTQAAEVNLEIGKAPMCVASKVREELEAKMPLPIKPVDIKDNTEARRLWCRSAAKVYALREKQISRSLQHTQLLSLAKKFKDEEAIYFPMQLDFRGRMYAVPSTLNPQGSDPAKALLTFTRGKALGSDGWRWLHIHIANMWGEDKVSFDAREEWTVSNMEWIISCVQHPFDHRKWFEADKPWQFLAACMELVAAVEGGEYESYISHLPITVDGTCNGLQHFSAMLLDEAGAAAVNLTPSEAPQDIYQAVADRVRSRLVNLVRTGGEGSDMAAEWLAWGFDRKATKRAVMIVPYSGTEYAAKEYTIDYIQDRKDCPFDDPFRPAYFFACHVWAAIAETIVSARQVMNWLRKAGRAVSHKGAPLIWTTPAGLPVKQDYRDTELYRVRTKIGNGVTFKPSLLKETGTLDHRSMEQGIAPNFVHSLDASCLMLTVNRAVDEGIQNFAMVHDSYGVLAADMDQLYVGLRQAFVDIYQNDVMTDFFKSATSCLSDKELEAIPAQPKKGKFKLELVKESKYFFA
jgi:DNA-directed RNA polymerase